ncbi:MAG: hypothetical protein ACRER8_03165 [Pseudomonas sp.]|uniref:hypothetical protein n=1 Tax=Pseudomonas sp. TaxID=306 RepID=UPI003D6E1F2C
MLAKASSQTLASKDIPHSSTLADVDARKIATAGKPRSYRRLTEFFKNTGNPMMPGYSRQLVGAGLLVKASSQTLASKDIPHSSTARRR